MTAEDVKARVSLRALFEQDGHVLKRAGSSLMCLSPFAQEKTPSCHVHEEEGYFKCFSTGLGGDCFVYWQETRKVDFKAALEALASIAGLSGGGPLLPPVVRPPRVEQIDLAPPLAGEDLERWLAGVKLLRDSSEEQQRIAAWRGYRVETVRWMAETGMMGLVPHYGVMREAFVVERPRVHVVAGKVAGIEGPGMIPIAYHVRLAPNTVGNLFPKASWRYQPPGCGAWPFVLGEVSTAKVVFATEGQWDSLALAQVMKWVGKIPPGVAIVGMRGATSWRKFADSFVWPKEAYLFGLPDRDAAGAKWFEEGGFLGSMQTRFFRVHAFRPSAEANSKDLNEMLKTGQFNGDRGEQLAALFRKKMLRKTRVVKDQGPTFLAWCRAQAKRREDEVGRACRQVLAGAVSLPKGWSKRRRKQDDWERLWQRTGVADDLRAHLRSAWEEWRRISSSMPADQKVAL